MARKKDKLDVKSMRAFIDATMGSLGATMKWSPDADLILQFKKGRPLFLKELQSMPDESPVWVTWKEHGETRFRINQAMRATRDPNHSDVWCLDDGSSFGAEFSPECGPADACFSSCCDAGEMHIYMAEPKARQKSPGSARTRR